MAMTAVVLAQRAQQRAERRAVKAERMSDLTATIAAAAIGKLSDDQLLELRAELRAQLGPESGPAER